MKATIKNKYAAGAFAACAALALLGSTANSEAAGYMKLGDIDGEATDTDHKDWIIIHSMSSPIFRAPVTDPATGVQRSRGDVVLGDIVCVKELDKSSPKLAEAVCNGVHIPEVTIHFTVTVQEPQPDGTFKNKQEPYLTYKLKDVIISSYSFHGNAAGDPLPTEEVTLGYTEVEWTYIVLDKDTKTPTGEIVQGSCPPTPGAP
ncbi:MAG: type VI secretion system tube protein Hcp [Verrucomicrobia bacterium]|nr:type VI secretion system tube protein Hcp [Verrucomicrobiota bacterium]MDA1005569.1 type VI secretion system tube protein Hcp [Verrucomicrobiota bacterium]